MLSFPVKFDLHHRPAPYLLFFHSLPKIAPVTSVRSEPAEEPKETDTLAFGHVSSASFRQPPPLLLRTKEYRSPNTRLAQAALNPLQSVLTKSSSSNSFRMNTYAKHHGGNAFTTHHSQAISHDDSFHSLLASARLSSRPRTKTGSPLARFSLFAPSLLPLLPHSSFPLFRLSPLPATLTNIPGGSPPHSPSNVQVFALSQATQPRRYRRIQFARISPSVPAPTIIHSTSPCSSGRNPTLRSVSRFNPVPIKNSVTVSPSFPTWFSKPKIRPNEGSSVFSSAARQKNKMNHGHWIFALVFKTIAVTTDSGTIHSARASFTVVPTASASAPYFAVAPTTELVSWMASADHNPNCDWLMCSAHPITGNRNSATEFRMNTVPSATAISSSLALAIGPTAAMALPPQIAVPALIRNAAFLPTRSTYPSPRPRDIATVIPIAVYRKPERPARATSCKFIPNPSATTEPCSRNFAQPRVSGRNDRASVNP